MQSALLIRLRPLGAWRFGPADGGHDQVDALYRSDRLYSAVTLAFERLGLLDQWLAATARAATPAVVFSSLFPFQGDTLYAIPPATLWPPPTALLTTPSPVFLTKIRWKTAHFVPLTVIDSLITGQPILADQWLPDPESACLLRRDRPSSSPFRVVVRSTAAVDRLTNTSAETRPLACVEFEQSAGLWTVARFAGAPEEQAWSAPLQAALRLLSDSGFGGGRSRGWGQTQPAEFQSGSWPGILLPKLGRFLRNAPPSAIEHGSAAPYWLLSLYSPAVADKIDWSGGNYSLTVRGGRVESHSGPGAAKKDARMVNEGCVLAASEEPVGSAVDVAPHGFAHPVYRSGLALALRLPVVEVQAKPVEEATTSEAIVEDLPPSLHSDADQTSAETPIAGNIETSAGPESSGPDIREPEARVSPPPPVEEPSTSEAVVEDIASSDTVAEQTSAGTHIAGTIEPPAERESPGPATRENEALVSPPPLVEEPSTSEAVAEGIPSPHTDAEQTSAETPIAGNIEVSSEPESPGPDIHEPEAPVSPPPPVEEPTSPSSPEEEPPSEQPPLADPPPTEPPHEL